MAVEYTLLMQKEASGSPLQSTLTNYGFAVRGIQWPDAQAKEPHTRDWPGEHGEDVYISATGLRMQAYDVEVSLLYSGEKGTAYAKHKALRDYLTGSGGLLMVYDPRMGVGRRGVYLRKIGDLKPMRTDIDEGLGCKVTFRVSDPKTEVTEVKNAQGVTTKLTVES